MTSRTGLITVFAGVAMPRSPSASAAGTLSSPPGRSPRALHFRPVVGKELFIRERGRAVIAIDKTNMNFRWRFVAG